MVQDRSHAAAADPAGTPVWLRPSRALDRFEPPEPVRLQLVEELRTQLRFGFRVGSLAFLIPSSTGSEVVPITSPPAVLPNSPRWLLGMVNVRGSLVPVFDLARVPGVEADRATDRVDPAAKLMILVLDKGDKAAGLLIDGFPRPLSGLRPAPQVPHLAEQLRAHVPAAYADEADIWLELGHEGLLRELGANAGPENG